MLLRKSSLPLSKLSPLWMPSFLLQQRQFHIEGGEAVSFLREVTKAPSKIYPLHCSRSHKGSTPRTLLSFLIHADRRPQGLIVKEEYLKTGKTGKVQTIRTRSTQLFYGPSLIGASRKNLDSKWEDYGPGGLGLLKKHREAPDQTIHIPLSQEKGLDIIAARESILELVPGDQLHCRHNKIPLKKSIYILLDMWNLFKECEGVWFSFEIVIKAEKVYLHAPYLEFDDFAVHRVKALEKVFANLKSKRDTNTAKAEDGGLFYIKLANGGKVGSFGYGAGNAMATMDGLAMAGATPANFLDGGGGANVANAKLAIETLNRDPDVKSIFVNTFGGLTRCSLVAEGIIEAVKENNIKTPITIRVMGTEAKEAKELLQSSGLPFTLEDDFKKAAQLAVEQAG